MSGNTNYIVDRAVGTAVHVDVYEAVRGDVDWLVDDAVAVAVDWAVFHTVFGAVKQAVWQAVGEDPASSVLPDFLLDIEL